jgi:hypothetical protein
VFENEDLGSFRYLSPFFIGAPFPPAPGQSAKSPHPGKIAIYASELRYNKFTSSQSSVQYQLAQLKGVQVSRTDFRPALLLLVLALPPPAAAAGAVVATVAVADQPLRVLRDTTFYTALRGAPLLAGDIVEAGNGTLQLEAPHCCTLALGPAARVYFKPGGKALELVLLGGWIKVQAPAGDAAAKISAGGLEITNSGSVIVHADAGKAELFVETGDPGVTDLQNRKAPAKVAREQYAVRVAGGPLKVLPRPPRQFLSGMPRAFQDVLLPVAFKGAAAAPKLERRATFAEVAPWLAAEPALHQAMYRRFHPPKPSPPKPTPHA